MSSQKDQFHNSKIRLQTPTLNRKAFMKLIQKNRFLPVSFIILAIDL